MMRIAMWSGPRNLSTALMYAFAARGDCVLWDEPFYASYLRATGLEHPMADQIMDADPRIPAEIAAALSAEVPRGMRIHYQKHMCQHMIDSMPRAWMANVTNVFLIRHPDRVLASFGSKYADISIRDIGFVQQEVLFETTFQMTGKPPLVIDSADIRAQPEATMRALCSALDLGYRPEMLHWQNGPKPFDGVWAPVWYEAVHRSRGFAGAEGPLPDLPPALRSISDAALPIYKRLERYKLHI